MVKFNPPWKGPPISRILPKSKGSLVGSRPSLYHASPLRNLKSILSEGLIATKGWSSESVKVTGSLEDLWDFIEESYEMVRYPSYGGHRTRQWAIFAIDPSGLKIYEDEEDPELEMEGDVDPSRLKFIGVYDAKLKKFSPEKEGG